jgi:hypothetical protein
MKAGPEIRDGDLCTSALTPENENAGRRSGRVAKGAEPRVGSTTEVRPVFVLNRGAFDPNQAEPG